MTDLPLDPVSVVRDLRPALAGDPIRWAVVVAVDLAARVATVRPASAPADGTRDVTARWLGPAPVVGGLARIETYRGDVLILGQVDAWPRQAAVTGTVPLAAASAGVVAIPWPAGRFSLPPAVFPSITQGSTRCYAMITANSTSSVSVTVVERDNQPITATVRVAVLGVQMTPTSATG